MERKNAPLGDVNRQSVALVSRVHQATSLLLAALAVSNGVILSTAGGPVATLVVDAFVVVLCLLDWWALRRFGFMRRSAVIIPVTLCTLAIVLVWFVAPDTWVWCMVCMVIAFVRLPIRIAVGISIVMWLAAIAAYVVKWDATVFALTRMVQSGAFLIVVLALARRVSDIIVRRLRDTSVLLRDAIEAIGPGLAVMDRDGYAQLFNERALETLGIPPEWRDGRPIHVGDVLALQKQRGDLDRFDTSPDVRAMIDAGMSPIDPRLPERYVRLDTANRWIEVATRRMVSGSTVRTYSDVTPYIEARRTAEQAAAARTTFLGHLSHEFRTPLNAVVGLTHLLLEDEPQGERRESLEGIESAARQLQQYADDMLDLASLESGASPLEEELFSLRELVERVVARKRARLSHRAVELIVDAAPGTARTFVGDAPRVERMLTTLLRNAELQTERGRIEVRVDGDARDASAMTVRVAVSDSGRGLTPGELASLDEFVSTRSPHPEEGNSYIGLGLVRRYAQLMGGEVGIGGEVGRGTTCWFTVRLRTATDAAQTVSRVPLPIMRRQGTDAEPSMSTEQADSVGQTTAAAQTDGRSQAIMPQPPAQELTPLTTTDAPPPETTDLFEGRGGSAAQVVSELMGQVAGRREDLDLLPYRAWHLATVVGGAVFLGMAAWRAAFVMRTGSSPMDGLLLMPLFTGLLMVSMAIRHRGLKRPFRRDAMVHLVIVGIAFLLSVRVNGILPFTLFPVFMCSLYLVQGRIVGRIAGTTLIAGALLLLQGHAADPELVVRLVAASLLSALLMEWLMHNLGSVSATIERAMHTLRNLSGDLIRENERLEHAVQRADAAVEQRTYLMATVSHEIRTPMNAILGLSSLVAGEPLTARQREWIDRIRDNGHHLLRLVNDLLDLTRIEAGRANLEVAPFDLEAVVRQLSDVLEQEGRSKGLQTSISVSSDVARHLMGDRTRLAQLLLNLVSNAIKYTERGAVEVRLDCADCSTTHCRLRFEVRDTGVGMTREQQARLFRRFEQLEPNSRDVGGAGLGLSICKWIADEMGGTISVRSQRDVGSTFSFVVALPKAEPPDNSSRDTLTARHAEHLRGIRVLVVDDHRINREVAGQLLRRDGVVVYEAADGEAALHAIARWNPDLVFMDVQMPLLDGLEATRRLRAGTVHRDLPVIAMTAAAFSADVARCREAGMNDFLAKPIEPDLLRAMVVRWVPRASGWLDVGPDDTALATDTKPAVSASPLAAHPLVALSGLDVAAGLRRAAGDRALYHTMLHSFIERHADAAVRLAERVAAGDRDGAKRIAHALCGVAGTLGALGVHTAARAVQVGIDSELPDPELIVQVEELRLQLDDLVMGLRPALAMEAV